MECRLEKRDSKGKGMKRKHKGWAQEGKIKVKSKKEHGGERRKVNRRQRVRKEDRILGWVEKKMAIGLESW